MKKIRRGTDILRPRKSADCYPERCRIRDEDDLRRRKAKSDRSWGWHLPSKRLKKWLFAQIGRPWNKVYQEFCEVFPTHDEAGRRAHEHLDWLVDRHCTLIEGVVKNVSFGRLTDITPDDLYVHPVDGLLKKGKKRNAGE